MKTLIKLVNKIKTRGLIHEHSFTNTISFLLSVSLSYRASLSISDDNLNITLTAGNLANLKWREGEKRLSPAAGGMRSRSEPVDGCEDDDDHC